MFAEVPLTFQTVLGEFEHNAQVLRREFLEDKMIMLKPGEENRLMREQSRNFLIRVLTGEVVISPIQLQHLMEIYEFSKEELMDKHGLREHHFISDMA